MASDDREKMHEMIERLPEMELKVVYRFLEFVLERSKPAATAEDGKKSDVGVDALDKAALSFGYDRGDKKIGDEVE